MCFEMEDLQGIQVNEKKNDVYQCVQDDVNSMKEWKVYKLEYANNIFERMHKKQATVIYSKERNQVAECGARKTYFSLNTMLCCVAFSYHVHVLLF